MKYSLLAISAVMIASSGCRESEGSLHVTKRSVTESVYASGIVKSDHQYQVYPAVNGIIEKVVVQEGDTVSERTPLIYLRNEVSSLNQENAKLAAQNSELKANKDKLDQGLLDMALARDRFNHDSLLFIRQQRLWQEGVGTKNEFDQRQLAYRTSQANYKASRLMYDELRRQLKFTDKQSQNNFKISLSQDRDHIIYSKNNGRVYKILREEGEFASTTSPVAIVGDATKFHVELDVDELDIARLKEGQNVLLTLDSYKGSVFEGSITTIKPLMNEATRSFVIYVDFKTRPTQLYPNLSVEANIIVRSRYDVVAIPTRYLVGDSSVVLQSGANRKVTIGLRDYQYAEIVSGLNVDDVIKIPEQ